MCFIVGPLFFMQVAIVSGVIQLFTPLPGPLSRPLFGYLDFIRPAFLVLEAVHAPQAILMVFAAAALFLPGWLPLLLTWLGLRARFQRDGVGGTLLSLGAREPRSGDLEEEQLVNVVEEMAIAAGLRPPRVVLLDDVPPNAAVIGSGPDDTTVVVARRLLDEFDRDQTLGVLGHLIGSASNGDLRIAFAIASIYQTLGVLLTLLDTPFSGAARASALAVVRAAFQPTRCVDTHQEDPLNNLLAHALAEQRVGHDMIGFFGADPDSLMGRLDRRLVISRPIRIALVLPLFLASLIGKFALLIVLPFFISPLIALAWRSRRYLADATAVQLTRDPQGLGDALVELNEKGGLPPGAQWAGHLFIVGTEGAQKRAVSAASEPSGFADQSLILVNFHPSLQKRLERLRAQGATVG